MGVGVTIFRRNPQKAHLCLISRVLSHYACISVHAFFARRLDEKRDTTKNYRDDVFHLFARNSPTQPNLTKSGIWVGVNVINHTKFGNDRYREFKVTEGRTLSCSVACRLYHCSSTTVLHYDHSRKQNGRVNYDRKQRAASLRLRDTVLISPTVGCVWLSIYD